MYNITDIYPKYVEWVEGKEMYTLRGPDFRRVTDAWNHGVVKALYEGKEFCMPSGLGKMSIVKSAKPHPTKGNSQIDWVNSHLAGKKVYFRNAHSDGYSYRLWWVKGHDTNAKNSKMYYFVPCREFKRNLAQIIKNRVTDYYQKK